MVEKPDFAELRRKRDEEVEAHLLVICESNGWDREKIMFHLSPRGCYCACPTGGPCEHQFQGWREHEDGMGGEQFCSLCDLGAMAHDMRMMP